jgi:hypothetical protein
LEDETPKELLFEPSPLSQFNQPNLHQESEFYKTLYSLIDHAFVSESKEQGMLAVISCP